MLSSFEDRGIIEPLDKEAAATAILAAYTALIEARDGEGKQVSADRVTRTMEALVSGVVKPANAPTKD